LGYNPHVTKTTESPEAEQKQRELSSGDGDPPVEDSNGDGDDEGEPIRWITVATYWQSEEAHLARIRLESEDIPCVIQDEQLGALGTFFASMIGGIKVQVPAEDAERASRLLESPPNRDADPGTGAES
jgi:hypothetical protein